MDTTPVVPRLSLSALAGGMGKATAAPSPSAPNPPAPPVGGRLPRPAAASRRARGGRRPGVRPGRLTAARDGYDEAGPVCEDVTADLAAPDGDPCRRPGRHRPHRLRQRLLPPVRRRPSAALKGAQLLPDVRKVTRRQLRRDRAPLSPHEPVIGLSVFLFRVSPSRPSSPGATCRSDGSPYIISPSVTTSGGELDHPVSGLLHTVGSVCEEKWCIWKGP